jgi:hypothetical protein
MKFLLNEAIRGASPSNVQLNSTSNSIPLSFPFLYTAFPRFQLNQLQSVTQLE